MAQLRDPSTLPLMPVGCWAIPLGIVAAFIIFGNNIGQASSWMLVLGVIFLLFGYSYGERAFIARRKGVASERGQWLRTFLSLAMAGLFLSLWFFSR